MKAINEFFDEDKSCAPANYEPRYSGPNRVGVCICGCPWDSHHLGFVMNKEYADATKEAYVPEECESFGFNEVGGLKYVDGQWVDHCHSYKDIGVAKKEDEDQGENH